MAQSREVPHTLGLLKKSNFSEERVAARSVKDELRSNLICKLQRGEALFPGIVGYEDTVVPQVVNAQRHKSFDFAPYPTISRIFETCRAHPAIAAAFPERQPDAEG